MGIFSFNPHSSLRNQVSSFLICGNRDFRNKETHPGSAHWTGRARPWFLPLPSGFPMPRPPPEAQLTSFSHSAPCVPTLPPPFSPGVAAPSASAPSPHAPSPCQAVLSPPLLSARTLHKPHPLGCCLFSPSLVGCSFSMPSSCSWGRCPQTGKSELPSLPC